MIRKFLNSVGVLIVYQGESFFTAHIIHQLLSSSIELILFQAVNFCFPIYVCFKSV